MKIGNDLTVVPPVCYDVLFLVRERVGSGSGSVAGGVQTSVCAVCGLLTAHAELEQYGKLGGSV